MLVFPWIIGLLVLALVAALVLTVPDVTRTLYRERRFGAHRPAVRAIAILTAIEVALVLAWALYVVADTR